MERGNLIAGRLALLAVMAVAVSAAGCSTPAATPTPAAAATGSELTFKSSVLVDDYENALPVTGQLVLGTLRLEDTPQKMSKEQAAKLLPFWQMLNSTSGIQDAAEASAVLRQVEAAMTAEQLQAIKAMKLTMDDMMAWAQEHDLNMAFRGSDGTLGVPPSGTPVAPGQWQGGPAERATLSPEMRATMEAGRAQGVQGILVGPGAQAMDPQARETARAQSENMTDEQREAMRATAQASGRVYLRTGGRGFAFGGALGPAQILLEPLLQMLKERAG